MIIVHQNVESEVFKQFCNIYSNPPFLYSLVSICQYVHEKFNEYMETLKTAAMSEKIDFEAINAEDKLTALQLAEQSSDIDAKVAKLLEACKTERRSSKQRMS